MAHTDFTAKHFVKTHFPTVTPTEPYSGWGKPWACYCSVHKKTFTTTYGLLKLQYRRNGTSLCPECKSTFDGPNNPAFVTQDEFHERLDNHFGKGQFTILSYSGKNGPLEVRHCCGNIATYRKASYLLGQRYSCTCLRTKALVPFSTLSDKEREFIAFCYEELSFSVPQIAELTGVLINTIRKILNVEGVQLGRNTTNGKRRTLEALHGASLHGRDLYRIVANRLTGYIIKAYRDILDPDLAQSREFHIDHRLSKSKAYSGFVAPLDLRILCHPANLVLMEASANIRKGAKCTITLAKLKSSIKKFELKHGKVIFPEHLAVNFSRDLTKRSDAEGLRVLGLDPGTANFGVFGGTLFGVKTLFRIKPIVTAMIKNTVKSLTNVQDESTLFIEEIDRLLRKVDPDVIVVERFQTRGLMGTTVEAIGFMLGIIAARAKVYGDERGRMVLVKLVIASQWKNAVNRKIDIQDMYELVGHKSKHHRLDALLMALSAFPDKDVYAFLTKKRQEVITNFIKAT